jgi:hypothetical protein
MLMLDGPIGVSALPIGTHFVLRYSEWWGSDEPGAVLSRDRWRIEARVDGYNGGGGYWITELWKWDRDGKLHHKQPRTLSYGESRELEAAYHRRQLPSAPPASVR